MKLQRVSSCKPECGMRTVRFEGVSLTELGSRDFQSKSIRGSGIHGLEFFVNFPMRK